MSNSHYDPSLPKYEWGRKWTTKAVSEKQFQMIERLASELHLTITSDLNILSRGTASMIIENLKCAKINGNNHIYYDDIRYRTNQFTFEEEQS